MGSAGLFDLPQMEVGAAQDRINRSTHSYGRDHLTFICGFTLPCCNLGLLRAEVVKVDVAVALGVGLRTMGREMSSVILSGFIFKPADADDP